MMRLFARSAVALVALSGLAACQPRSSAVADGRGEPGASSSSIGSSGSSSATSTTSADAPHFAVMKTSVGADPGRAGNGTPLIAKPGDALAAFAEGCFWGSENTFRHVEGVVATAVGYAGGHTEHPSYEDVCSHTTGHAEAVLVEFDPKKVTYAQLLRAFWDTHDPTTLNRQGPDVGDQYRSAIFTFSPEQEADVKRSIEGEQRQYERKITTEVRPMPAFWKAEGYHQQYDEKTGRESCPLPKRRGI
jgi:peptide-methionine (S)-S-oxide reductase